ncbi:MAG: hypothetical protein AABM43_12025 [Actinomycetota bacterium]
MKSNHVRPRRGSPLRRGALAALAACALLAYAGCGDDGDKPSTTTTAATLTKHQVISQGSAICRAAERGVRDLPQLTSDNPFAKGSTPAEHRAARRFLAGYADLLEQSRDGLAGLAAPPEDLELLDGYIEDIGAVADQLREASTAPGPEVKRIADRAFARFEQASAQTKHYGFPRGVCGAG